MKKLNQLKEKARKAFKKKFVPFMIIPNKGIKCEPFNQEHIKAFLDTQIEIAYEEGKEKGMNWNRPEILKEKLKTARNEALKYL